MKSIIQGFRYDTEKAERIGYATYAGHPGDPHWWEATLYKTPRVNRYFLAGRGGFLTRWAKPGGQWGVGSGIHPISHEAADEWLKAVFEKD